MAQTDAGLEIPIGITDQKALQAVVRLVNRSEQEFRRLEKTAATANAGITRSFGQMSNASRGQLQNVSFQLQDIFVQLNSGTSAAQALGQQLPQLLGGFGAFGAALGLVAAAVVPMAVNFLTAGEEAADLEKQLKDLTGALDSYKSTLDSAIGPMDDLWEKFGRGAEAARETYEALLEIERIKYLREMSDTVGALSEKMQGLSEAVARWQSATTLPAFMREEALAGAAQATQELQAQFGLTVVEANRVAMAMERLGTAREQGPAATADAARDLAEQLMSAYEAGGQTNAELLAAAESAYELSINAREAAQMMGDVADGSVTAADAADEAAAATANWAATMASVRAEINAIASALSQMGGGMIANASKFVELNALKQGATVAEASRARQRAQMEAEFAAQEAAAGTWAERLLVRGQRALANKGLELDEQLDSARAEARETAREAAKAARGGGRKKSAGRGRKGKEERPFFENVERDLLQLERQLELIGKTSEEVATMEARWAMLDEAKKRGITVNETLNGQIEAQAAQVGQLTAELERAEIAQQQFDEAVDGIADAFAGAIIAGESLREGLAQVFKQIASDILQSGIREALGSVFNPKGGGTSLLGNIFGGIFGGGKLPSFDGGGFTGYGPRSGGIDGIGGIPAIVHPNETIVDHSKGQRLGGASSVALTIDLRGTTGDAALDQKIAQAGQKILQQVPSVMDNVNKRQR